MCVPFQRGPLFSVLLLADCAPPFGATSWTTSTHCFLVTVGPVVLIVVLNLRHLLGTPSSPKDPSYPHLDHSPTTKTKGACIGQLSNKYSRSPLIRRG